jgi:hypothetical protein
MTAHQLRHQLLPAVKESVRTGTDVLLDSEEGHRDARQTRRLAISRSA